MQKERLKVLLTKYKNEKLSLEEVITEFKHFTFGEIEDVKVDLHREIRRGYPEVIFGQNKSAEQISKIITVMSKNKINVMTTRVSPQKYKSIKKIHKKAIYNESAGIVFLEATKIKKAKGLVAVISAGTSDIPVAEEAAFTAEIFGNKVERVFDVGVAGLHRLLAYKKVIKEANVIVVAAGMEGALPSIIGGLTDKAVIGLPTSIGYGAALGGIAPLLTMLNSCTSNVAVVNIDNGFSAGYLAAIINKMNTGE